MTCADGDCFQPLDTPPVTVPEPTWEDDRGRGLAAPVAGEFFPGGNGWAAGSGGRFSICGRTWLAVLGGFSDGPDGPDFFGPATEADPRLAGRRGAADNPGTGVRVIMGEGLGVGPAASPCPGAGQNGTESACEITSAKTIAPSVVIRRLFT